MKKKNNKKEKNEVSEEEFLEALNNITTRLAYKFKFGYHSYEDMCQQAAIFAIQGLEKYDHKRPLENFLWTHVRNRLFNFKRDNYRRPDKPCHSCPFYDKLYKKSSNQCLKYTNVDDCSIFYKWSHRNTNKENIMKPAPLEDNMNGSEYLFNNIADAEILNKIEMSITGEIREIYLKLKHGSKVSKADIKKLKNFIDENINE